MADSLTRLRTIIVDDETLSRSNVATLLRRDPEIEIVCECSSGAQALDEIRRSTPDLIFLDVQMPECDGFDVLEQLGDMTAEIVFVTAYDRYALQAFEAGASLRLTAACFTLSNGTFVTSPAAFTRTINGIASGPRPRDAER